MCSGKSEKLEIANKEFSLYIKKNRRQVKKYISIFLFHDWFALE